MRKFGLVSSLGLIVLMLISITGIVRASALVPLAPVVPNMISVVTGTNGDLYWNGFYTDHWAGWERLSGGSPSPPGLCQSGPGRVELVVEGYDENIYHKSFINGTWSPAWDKVPTGATDLQPACGVLGTTMHLVVRGTDTNLWANSLDLNTGIWSPWVGLSGSSPSAPALAASPLINSLDLVVRGEDNAIYHTWFASGSWSMIWDQAAPPFNTCGATRTFTTPAIVGGNAAGTSIIQVAILGADNAVYSVVLSAGRSWGGPLYCGGWGSSIGNFAHNSPTLAIDTLGQPNSAGTVYALYAGGFDGGIHLKSRNFDLTSSWGGDFATGGNTGNRPAGAMVVPGTIGAVVSGGSKDLWYNTFTCCGSFSGWTALTGSTSEDPSLITVP